MGLKNNPIAPLVGELTRPGLLIQNSVWSLLGRILPLVAGVAVIPFLLNGLGLERFALLSLLWLYVAYLTGLDLGVSKGVVKYTAEALTNQDRPSCDRIAFTALLLNFALGFLFAIVIWLVSPWIVYDLIDLSSELHTEALQAFRITALLLPLVLVQSVLTSILSAHQRFKLISVLQMMAGVVHYLVPFLVAFRTQDLSTIMTSILGGKALLLLIQVIWMSKDGFLSFAKSKHTVYSNATVRMLLGFGGWVTLSNLLSSAFDQLDRYVIAALLTAGILAYFSTPVDVFMRISILPTAIITVFFPAISALGQTSPDQAFFYVKRANQYLFVALTLLFSLFLLFAEELLTLWISAEFAAVSYPIAQILAIGFLFKYLSYMPVTYIYGAGNPATVAKVHVVEFILYVLLLPLVTRQYGLIGTAIVFSCRLVLEHIYFSYLAWQEEKFSTQWLLPVWILMISLLGFLWIDKSLFVWNWPALVVLAALISTFTIYFRLLNSPLEIKGSSANTE